jgi:hypothetical protein
LPVYADKPACFFHVQSVKYPNWDGSESGIFVSPKEKFAKMPTEGIDTVLKLPPLPSPLWEVDINQSVSQSGRELILSFSLRNEEGVAAMVVVQPVVIGRSYGDCTLVMDTQSYSQIPTKN